MRAPAFWSDPPERPSWPVRLLWPASQLWRLGSWVRAHRTVAWRAPVPVICIGNLTAGGTGKTPLVAALLPRLCTAGLSPHVLSRGYGGRLHGPHRVDPTRDSAAAVGDEALLLAAHAPVWIARARAAAAKAAVAAGAGALVMDDGHQNPALAKDLSLVVVDAEAGFGNGRLMPAGPLREPIATGLARADLGVLVGPEAARARTLADWPALAALAPVGAQLVPAPDGPALEGARVIAFAGIGRPEKFFATLKHLGAEIVATYGFADHYAYPEAVLARLGAEAEAKAARLVTTEKDAVRLPPAWRARVEAVPVRLHLDDWSRIERCLTERTANA